MTEAEWQPTLIYPARGVALLWESASVPRPTALAKVMGSVRAALSPTSTRRGARPISPSGSR